MSTAKAEARRVQALDLRLAGATYRDISSRLGVTVAQSYKDVQQALRDYCQDTAEEVRDQELARLDRLMLAHWQRALNGDHKSTATVLSIMDRRAKILGLDAPAKVDITMYIRQKALEEGLDPDEAVRAAEQIAAGVKW